MKTQLVNNSTILVLLSKEDLKALNIEPLKIDFSDEKTRSLLMYLLDQAQSNLNFSLTGSGKTIVEVLPFENGECLISYSKEHSEKPRLQIRARKKSDRGRVFALESREAVNALLCAISSPCEIYKNDDMYRVILKDCSTRERNIACEFGRELTYPLAQYYTREYFTCLNS